VAFGNGVAFSQGRPELPATAGVSPAVLWNLEINKMKTLFFLFVVCVFCAVGAVAQVSGGTMNAQPQALVMPGHPMRATQTVLPAGQSLMERSGSTSAHGQRPLWEVMPEAQGVPLGDTARAWRKEHATAKKAATVWSN
jgi:hypothetical protein